MTCDTSDCGVVYSPNESATGDSVSWQEAQRHHG